MSEHNKTLIATGAVALAIPLVGHADPARDLAIAGRALNAVTPDLSGQNLLTQRQQQTRGLQAERRGLLSAS